MIMEMQENDAIGKKDLLGAAPEFAIVLAISHPISRSTAYKGKFTF